jgi:hypothetical protein
VEVENRELVQIGAARHSGIRVVISVLLAIACAVCFKKYLGWAWVYSGQYGLPSATALVAQAGRWALIYLWIGLFAEGALIVNLIVTLRQNFFDMSGPLRVLARGTIAITIAALGTMTVALMLIAVGRMLH